MKLEEIQQKKLAAIAKKLEKRLKSEGFGGPDYTIRAVVDHQYITVTVDINFFLPDSKEGSREFNTILRDVEYHCTGVGELRTQVGKETYFGGPASTSLIKRGKTVSADALLSTVQVELTFASNFK